MKQERFLEILMSKTPEEINEYIRKKGKSGKLVNAVCFFSDKKVEDGLERKDNQDQDISSL